MICTKCHVAWTKRNADKLSRIEFVRKHAPHNAKWARGWEHSYENAHKSSIGAGYEFPLAAWGEVAHDRATCSTCERLGLRNVDMNALRAKNDRLIAIWLATGHNHESHVVCSSSCPKFTGVNA